VEALCELDLAFPMSQSEEKELDAIRDSLLKEKD